MTEINQVPSPCIRNCCLDGDDICLGCLRHLNEIIEWGAATDERRREILSIVENRKESKRKAGKNQY